MDYINVSTEENAGRTQSAKIKLIHKNVQKVRTSEKMGVKYMQLWEEKEYIREDAREEGREEGLAAGQELGLRAFIEDNLEEGKDKEVIIGKLMKHFSMSEETAEECFKRLGDKVSVEKDKS